MKPLHLLTALLLAFVPMPAGTVSVVYAGSLVRTMEGPLAASLRAHTGLRLEGEAKGSDALAHLIAAGLRTPDVFISADPKLLRGLAPAIVFGSARMVIAYSDHSPERALLRRAGPSAASILAVLADPRVQVGRTDPQLDPKGRRILHVLQLLGARAHEPALAARVASKSATFPEEDLAVRVESGELDAGFFYSTETQGRGLHVVELPPGTNLSGRIDYAIAQMPSAPHPQAAARFVDFVLHGDGKAILEAAGLRFFAHPQRIPE